MLAQWSGLGYNRRALALQAAARVVAERGWPDDLTELPGVGPYTAAAVASFAWDRQRAAVDVNVGRVIERWDGRRHPPRALAGRAEALLPAGRAATWNQAMMELGATVCTARSAALRGLSRRRVVRECRGAAGGGAARCPPALRGHRPLRARPRRRRPARAWRRCPTLEPERLERALAGLARDGLIVRDAAGAPALP